MKKILYIILLIFISFNICYADNIKEIDISTTSKEIILYNLNDDNILYEVESNKKVQIASITKIMTSIIALENIDDLNKEVTIDNKVFYGLEGYSKAGFKVGEKVTYLDLLYGVLLPSGADAVNAIVQNITTEDNFIKLMNNKAEELKMTNTHYDNAIGMDSENNYSTAYDQAILLKYALKNEDFYKVFTTRVYTVDKYNLKLESTLIKYSNTTNIDTSIIKGAKSGFTDNAGLCLASIATINDVDYLLINLTADYTTGKHNAILDALNIYNYYKDNYSYKRIVSKNQIFKIIKNKFGYEKEYAIYSKDNIDKYLSNDIDITKLEYTYEGITEIDYKNKVGDKLGTVTISYEDNIIDTYTVYLNDKLDYYYPINYIIVSIFILFILLVLLIIRKKIRKRRRKKRKRRHHK